MEMNFLRLVTPYFVASTVVVLLIIGWQLRDEYYFAPERGSGYALGIIGGSMMLALLLYPLRKRLRAFNRFFSVRFWFRLHMLFGVFGPVAVLYHCNFSLGSLNSNVALFCMVVVAMSGLVGRYLYQKIHMGLYGERVNLLFLKQSMEELVAELSGEHSELGRSLRTLTSAEEDRVFDRHPGFLSTFSLGLRYAKWRRKYGRIMKQRQVDSDHQFVDKVEQYLASLWKYLGLGVYEKLFGIWHVVHMPLFVVLVLSATIHVVAVHMY